MVSQNAHLGSPAWFSRNLLMVVLKQEAWISRSSVAFPWRGLWGLFGYLQLLFLLGGRGKGEASESESQEGFDFFREIFFPRAKLPTNNLYFGDRPKKVLNCKDFWTVWAYHAKNEGGFSEKSHQNFTRTSSKSWEGKFLGTLSGPPRISERAVPVSSGLRNVSLFLMKTSSSELWACQGSPKSSSDRY